MAEHIKLMLEVYRESLEKAHISHDYLRCIQISARIDVLENLYMYALTKEGK